MVCDDSQASLRSGPAKRPRVAQACLVSLRDTIGNRIGVQVFHARLTQLDDGIGYLIGICKCGESPALGERTRASDEHLAAPAQPAPAQPAPTAATWGREAPRVAAAKGTGSGHPPPLGGQAPGPRQPTPREPHALSPSPSLCSGPQPNACRRGTPPTREPQALSPSPSLRSGPPSPSLSSEPFPYSRGMTSSSSDRSPWLRYYYSYCYS